MIINQHFPEIHGNFGFGCMRLPMLDDDTIDIEQMKQMVDEFLAAGFNYFDTAHPYHNKKSEPAVREALTSRYPRDRFLLADKMSSSFFDSEENVREQFMKQLEICGVEYFDFFLMHALSAGNYEKYKRCNVYKVLTELKAEGRIRHLGFSFHDKPEMLEMILSECPEVEFVQIQFNYIDFDDPIVQSKACYDVCERHGKPVVVMEPVKGGTLVKLPPAAASAFDGLTPSFSKASYALRFVGGFPNVAVMLSGMSNIDQMRDNISTMKDFTPLSEAETAAVERSRMAIRSLGTIACTGCRYCTEVCPQDIIIPEIMAILNLQKMYVGGGNSWQYWSLIKGHGKASDCLECGACEAQCPQHLPIRSLLKEAVEKVEKKPE